MSPLLSLQLLLLLSHAVTQLRPCLQQPWTAHVKDPTLSNSQALTTWANEQFIQEEWKVLANHKGSSVSPTAPPPLPYPHPTHLLPCDKHNVDENFRGLVNKHRCVHALPATSAPLTMPLCFLVTDPLGQKFKNLEDLSQCHDALHYSAYILPKP